MMNLVSLFQNSANKALLPVNTTLFESGEDGDHMYVVVKGEVDIQIGDSVVETAGPGDIVGEMALIDHSARSATAIAKTDCEVVPVDERRFLFLVQEHPLFAQHVMRVMANRLRRMSNR
jgi:CRP-like cAMP-binding protein